ncbi:MAG: DMT family transporter [Rhizobiaceae bacterium]|nr:DMT family transporter [Rhizobiaceae bacterium]
MVASGILFACLDTTAKLLVVSGLPAPFVAWIRFAVNAAMVVIVFRPWRPGSGVGPRSLTAQVLRAVTIFVTTILNFMALRTLQLAETTSILFLQPMVITALAGPLLGEWAGWRRWLAVGVGFIGVLVIARPGFGVFHIGHAYALGAMLSGAFYAMMTRALSGTETPQSLIFFQSAVPTLLLLPVVPFAGSMPSHGYMWLLFLSMGFYAFFGHWLLIKAYRAATATALAPYPYLQMIWMIGAGYLVFDQLPDLWTVGGSAIIVAGGLYIVHREHRLRLANRAALTAETETLAEKPEKPL